MLGNFFSTSRTKRFLHGSNITFLGSFAVAKEERYESTKKQGLAKKSLLLSETMSSLLFPPSLSLQKRVRLPLVAVLTVSWTSQLSFKRLSPSLTKMEMVFCYQSFLPFVLVLLCGSQILIGVFFFFLKSKFSCLSNFSLLFL